MRRRYASLSRESRRDLAGAWLDRAIRVRIAGLLEASGEEEKVGALSSLPGDLEEIRDLVVHTTRTLTAERRDEMAEEPLNLDSPFGRCVAALLTVQAMFHEGVDANPTGEALEKVARCCSMVAYLASADEEHALQQQDLERAERSSA